MSRSVVDYKSSGRNQDDQQTVEADAEDEDTSNMSPKGETALNSPPEALPPAQEEKPNSK